MARNEEPRHLGIYEVEKERGLFDAYVDCRRRYICSPGILAFRFFFMNSIMIARNWDKRKKSSENQSKKNTSVRINEKSNASSIFPNNKKNI